MEGKGSFVIFREEVKTNSIISDLLLRSSIKKLILKGGL
jgi:hypothetical protein